MICDECYDISNSLFLYVEMILLLMGKNAMIANRVSVVSHFAVLVVVLNSTNIENIVTSKKNSNLNFLGYFQRNYITCCVRYIQTCVNYFRMDQLNTYLP